MFGYSAEEVIGQPVDLLFTPEDRASGVPKEELQSTITGQRGLHERWHIRKDGSRLFLSGAVRPMYDGDGRLKGFAKIARDSTERKQLEEALDDSRDNLEKIVQERTARLQETVGELEAFCYSLPRFARAIAPWKASPKSCELALANGSARTDSSISTGLFGPRRDWTNSFRMCWLTAGWRASR